MFKKITRRVLCYFLFFYIVLSQQRKFNFFYSRLFFFRTIIFVVFRSIFFVFELKIKIKIIKNVLRDLIDNEIINIIKYSFNLKLKASTNEFFDLKSYVNEFEQKFKQKFN